MTALEFWEWIESPDVRAESLTIQDVLDLPLGRPFYVLPLHRNLCDEYFARKDVLDLPSPARPIETAEQAFRHLIACFTPASSGQLLHGRMLWSWDASRAVVDEMGRPWSWEVEWKSDHWFPTTIDAETGVVRMYTRDEDPEVAALIDSGERFPEGKPLEDLHPGTRVGYRGPMIRGDALVSLPNVYGAVDLDLLAAKLVERELDQLLPELSTPSWDLERVYLRRTEHGWTLTAWDLTERERDLIVARLPGVHVEAKVRVFTPGELSTEVVDPEPGLHVVEDQD